MFIIPGFTEKPGDKQYAWMKKHFKAQGYEVKVCPIDWKYKVMSDYVEQFKAYYQKYKGNNNTVLCFSFGAMTAFITASELQPDRLVLCSLSPYFKEDLPGLPDSWWRIMGKKRKKDFQKFSAKKIAEQVKFQTTIFCGEKEGGKYWQLMQRCENTNNAIAKSKLIMVKDSPHQIDFPTYQEAIKQWK